MPGFAAIATLVALIPGHGGAPAAHRCLYAAAAPEACHLLGETVTLEGTIASGDVLIEGPTAAPPATEWQPAGGSGRDGRWVAGGVARAALSGTARGPRLSSASAAPCASPPDVPSQPISLSFVGPPLAPHSCGGGGRAPPLRA